MKLEKLLGAPALIIGVVLSLGTIMGWFGFGIHTPTDTLENHIIVEQLWQDSAEAVHISLENVADTIHNDIHTEREEIDSKLEVQQVLLESLVSRSCLRDDYEELVLQRLIPICENLGIHRTRNSVGARAALPDTTSY